MKCEKVFNEIQKLESEYLDILEDVCNIESPTVCKEGVDAVGKYFIKKAEELGFDVEVSKQEVSGDAICITMNPNANEKPVCASGHIDTVHPIGLFGNPPVKRDDKNMYGPGVMDCKGGTVAALLAMHALKNAGFTARPVKLILQTDEENSSATSNKKTIEFMCDKAQGAVAFLNLEGIKGETAVLRRKGILRYKFTVHGCALHSARCHDASSAIVEAAHKIIELESLKDADGLTCNCGIVNGGSAMNTVPEKCVFYADIRFATNEELASVKNFAKKVAEKVTVSGTSCDIEEISFRPAMVYTERNENLLSKMNEIYAENGLPRLTARLCLSGSDAAYITESGIPCVDNLGTHGSNIHSINEYIELKSLAESAKRIAAVAYCI